MIAAISCARVARDPYPTRHRKVRTHRRRADARGAKCPELLEIRRRPPRGTIENSKSTGISDCVGRSVEPTGKSVFQAHQKAAG
jgi:hypothetical protein